MALKSHKPTTPSMRHTVLMDKSNVSMKKPEKKLTKNVKYNAGRSKGRITMRHKGGRVKRLYRYLDFKRNKRDIEAVVEAIEYDPYRSANIALLKYKDGERRYIIAPDGLKIGQVWLIDKTAFEAYLDKAVQATDRRFGPNRLATLSLLEY